MAVPRLPRRARLPPTPPPSPRLTLLPPLQKLAIRAESIGRPAARVQGKKSEREREISSHFTSPRRHHREICRLERS